MVHRYPDETTFEVEFVTAGGDTLAVLTLTNQDIRPMLQNEMLHVRTVAA